MAHIPLYKAFEDSPGIGARQSEPSAYPRQRRKKKKKKNHHEFPYFEVRCTLTYLVTVVITQL